MLVLEGVGHELHEGSVDQIADAVIEHVVR
jgi:hypothetical protein